MSKKHNFLAFDCGATSGRAVLATVGDGEFEMREIHRFPDRILDFDGKFCWDVYGMFNSFREALAKVAAEGVEIESIGIDTWGVDFGFLSPDGLLAGLPRCYRDPYTSGIPEEVFRSIPRGDLYARTGIQIMDFNTVFQLYAQTSEGVAAFREARSILFMPDLLSYMLTGNAVCEYTIASTSGMMDQKTRQFDKSLPERLGIRSDVLLPVIQPGAEIRRYKGIPVIAVAGHDTASAVAAVPAADGNFAFLSSGTWSLMGIEVPEPVINAESARQNFTNEGGIEGTTRFLKNITGMWLLEQCRKVWKASGKDYSYSRLEEMAMSEKDFSGRIDPDDPRFANPGNMVEEICAVIGKVSDARIVSCIYHSLADCYGKVLADLRGFAPFPIERLHIIGGGSANGLLNRWTAETVGIPVVAGPTEATAIGNVMMQAKAAGLVRDRWEMRRMIADAIKVKSF